MRLMLPCGCNTGGINDWVCSSCGHCGRCCECGAGHAVHINSAAGAAAIIAAFRKLKARGEPNRPALGGS